MNSGSDTSNVIVTGGAGFVGSHVAKALAQSGFTPVTYDNLSRGFAESVRWGPLIEADLADEVALNAAFTQYTPVGVIHLAAYAYVHESVEYPLLYFRNNVGGSERLFSTMCKAGIDKIVFSSTCSIYGIVDSETIDEKHPAAPINPYAQSKWIVEQMLSATEIAHGVRSVRLRYFNAAGADPDGEIGESHDPETHLIPLVLQVAAGHRTHVDIFGDDYPTEDGTAVRDYIHVSDLADAHVLALRHLLDGGEGFAANLANGRGYSVREVIDTAVQVTGLEIPFRTAARRPGDPPRLVGDASLARNRLGWSPKRSELGRQISDAWRWLNRKKLGK
jgi:UDP-arabinose 4-epimerase